MKRIITFAMAVCMMMPCVSAANLAWYDFENITDNAYTYIKNSEDVSISTTNAGIKSYDFIYKENSTRLKFIGYTKDENANAGSTVTFNFDKYTLEKYPDTKLVIGYNEILNKLVLSYSRFIIPGNGGNYVQTFEFAGDAYSCKLNNNGNASYTNIFDEKNEYKYVIDFETGTVTLTVGGIKKKAIGFTGSAASAENKSAEQVKFNVGSGHEFSVDELYAFAVPNTFDVVSYDAVPKVTDTVKIKLTAPADSETLDKISVSTGGETVDCNITSSMEEECIYIDFLGNMEYATEYTVSFGEGFCDIAGNTMTKDITFKTEELPEFEVKSESVTSGNDISYTVTAKNVSEETVKAYIITALYDANGLLKACTHFAQKFEPGAEDSVSGIFKNAAGYTVKAYAAGNSK